VLADKWRSDARQAALVQRLTDEVVKMDTSIDEVAESVFIPGTIRDALLQLRTEDREVITLVAWHGFNTEQIAAALGCSKALASLKLHRARSRFAKQLDRRQHNSAQPRHQMLRTAKEVP
jgi:RNA polymerase sigma-70 factor (ECF subfamily)